MQQNTYFISSLFQFNSLITFPSTRHNNTASFVVGELTTTNSRGFPEFLFFRTLANSA